MSVCGGKKPAREALDSVVVWWTAEGPQLERFDTADAANAKFTELEGQYPHHFNATGELLNAKPHEENWINYRLV